MNTPYATMREVEAVIDAFEQCTLPAADWNHATHLTVGIWYMVYWFTDIGRPRNSMFFVESDRLGIAMNSGGAGRTSGRGACSRGEGADWRASESP